MEPEQLLGAKAGADRHDRDRPVARVELDGDGSTSAQVSNGNTSRRSWRLRFGLRIPTVASRVHSARAAAQESVSVEVRVGGWHLTGPPAAPPTLARPLPRGTDLGRRGPDVAPVAVPTLYLGAETRPEAALFTYLDA